MTNPNQPLPSPSWKDSGKRDGELVCLALGALGPLTFEQLSNAGNTVIADAVKNLPARSVDDWHEGFTSIFMPFLAGMMKNQN